MNYPTLCLVADDAVASFQLHRGDPRTNECFPFANGLDLLMVRGRMVARLSAFLALRGAINLNYEIRIIINYTALQSPNQGNIAPGRLFQPPQSFCFCITEQYPLKNSMDFSLVTVPN